jgi:hypothetical protein
MVEVILYRASGIVHFRDNREHNSVDVNIAVINLCPGSGEECVSGPVSARGQLQ